MRKVLRFSGFLALYFLSTIAFGQVLINEDFSTATGTTPPTGWSNIDSSASGEVWEFNNPGSRTLNAPISSPAAIFDSDNYGSGAPAEDAYLESPSFDVSASTGSIFLSFDHYFRGGSGGSYEVLVYDGSTWTIVASGSSSSANPAAENIDITTAAGGSAVAQVRFRWQGDWSWYWVLDNVKVEEIGCVTPSALGATNLTTTSADVYWTSGGATNWNIEYGAAGFTLGTGMTMVAPNDTVTIPSLSANTSYEFYVQDSCGVGNTSGYAGPFQFRTAAMALTLPYANDFETTLVDFYNASSNTDDWVIDTAQSTGTTSIANAYSANADNFLILPNPIDLSVYPNAVLSFDQIAKTEGTWDECYVQYSADSGQTWQVIPAANYTGSATDYATREYFHEDSYSDWGTSSTPIDNSMWKSEEFALSGLSSGYIMIRFYLESDGSGQRAGWYIDNLSLTNPSCAAPTGLGATSVLATSAKIYWTSGGASNWNVEYGPTGFTPGSGTTVVAINDTVTISPLTAETTYDFYVQDSCGAGNVSSFAGPSSFTTACTPINSFPYVQDFETSGSSIPNCWTNATDDDANWVFRSGSIGHGSTTDNTLGTSSGFYAGMDDSQSSPNDTLNNLLTPLFDLTSLTSPELDFFYFIGNDNVLTSRLIIDVYDGTSWNMDVSTITFTAAAWLRHTVDLTPYASTATQIRFRGIETTDFNSDISIDDVLVREMPSCSDPTGLTFISSTDSSVTITWTSGGASNWNVQYDTAGFTLGSGTVLPATNDTITIGSLMDNTSYEFYVQDSCGAGDVSLYIGPLSVTTPCAAIAAPYIEDFSSGSLPICWNQDAVTGGPFQFTWTSNPDFGSNNAFPDHTNGTVAAEYTWVDMSSTDVAVTLEMPVIDVSTLTTPQLSFWVVSTTTTTSIAPDYNILYAESFDGTNWVVMDSVQGDFGLQWVNFTVDLTTYVSNASTVQLRFRQESGGASFDYDNDMLLDDVEVRETPSCSAPTAPSVLSATDSSVTIYWTTGGAANWNVQYGATGFTLGSGTVLAATNDTITIPSLMDNTTYDFYVQDSCGLANVSAYAGPLTASTLCSVLPLPYVETFEVASSTTLSCLTAQANWALAAVGGYGTSTNSLTFPFYNVNGGTFSAFSAEFAPTPAGYQLSLDHAKSAYQTEADSIKIYYSMDGGTTYTLLVGLDGSATGPLTTAGANLGAFTPTATQWSTFNIALPTGVNRLRVDAVSAFGNNLYIDNLSVDAIPNCPAPSSIGLDAVTLTDATIYWTSGGASNWNVQYGPAGFALGSGTVLAATNDTTTLSPLTQATTYDVYVQDSCGPGNVSTYVGPFTFTTACGTLPAPYTEDFGSGTIPTCWSQSASTGGPFQFTWTSNPDFGTNNAFPDHTNGTVAAEYTWVDMSQTDSAVVLNMPVLDVSTLTAPELSFWIVSTTTNTTIAPDYNILYAESFDGTNWVTIDTVQGDFGLNWVEFIVDLTPYVSTASTVELRFRQESGGAASDFDNDMLLDDVSVREAPACVAPSGFTVDTATTTSISISWTSDPNAVGGYVEYGPTGFTPGTGTVLPTTTDSTTIPTLMSNTCYDIYIADTCNDGSLTFLSGPFNACTACGSFAAPFFEGFETSMTVIPQCWSSFSSTGEQWRYSSTNIGHSASTGANGSTYFAAFDDSETPVTTDGTLETPFIDVTALNLPALSFYLWSDAEDGSGVAAGFPLNATIMVDVWDGAAWNTLLTRTGNTNGWEQIWVDLTGLNITGDIQIRFIIDEDHGGGFDDDISIDDIFVTERPACFDPTNLTLVGTGLTSVDISWTSDTTVSTSIVEYGLQGFTLGSGTQLPATPSSASIPNLMSGTCYDFYVLDSCSGGFTSWLGPITGCTQLPCIVTTVPTTTDDSICGGGIVTLSAMAGNSNSDVAWILNGDVVALADSISLDIASNTTVDAHDYSVVGPAQHVGPLPSIATTGFGNFTNGQFITVLDTLYIDSTTVRANGYVNAQVVIRDSAGVDIIQRGAIFETDSNVTANYQVPVDVLLVPGNYFIGVDFDITAVSLGALFRATGGAVYPYQLPGLLDITGVNFAGPRYYYVFDLVISRACLGTPVPALGKVLGSSAGLSLTANVCETESAVDLANLIGPHTFGGTWTDLSGTGALTDSIFDATVNGAGGPYNFTYVVTGSSGCPDDTAFVTIISDTVLSPGTSTAVTLCTDNTSFLSLRTLIGGADAGGTWTDLDSSGALIGSDRIRPSNGTAGVYRFRYVFAQSGACPADSATLTVTLDDPVDAGADANDTTCVNSGTTDLSTYLSTSVTAGGTWVDVDGSGGLSGSNFDPSGVTPNTTYEFRYIVSSANGGCMDSASVFLFVCDDVSNPEYKLDNIRLYPNPTNGVFFVEDVSADNEGFSIEVMGLDGKLIQTDRFDTGEKQTIDISALPSGIYNVKVITKDGFKVFRVISQD